MNILQTKMSKANKYSRPQKKVNLLNNRRASRIYKGKKISTINQTIWQIITQ